MNLVLPGGTVTNNLAHIDIAFGLDGAFGHYKGCSDTVEIAEAGTYVFQFCMPTDTWEKDAANIIDNVSFVREPEGNLISNWSFDEGSLGLAANASTAYRAANASGYSNPGWTTTPTSRTGINVSGGGTWAVADVDLGLFSLYLQTGTFSGTPSGDAGHLIRVCSLEQDCLFADDIAASDGLHRQIRGDGGDGQHECLGLWHIQAYRERFFWRPDAGRIND